MMQCLLYESGKVQEIGPEVVAGHLNNPSAIIWVDLETPTEAEGEILGRSFGFHPLAIEDCISPQMTPPKLDDYGSYLFLIVHGIDHNLPPGVLDTHELDLFLGPNYLVTCHHKPSRSIRNTRDTCPRRPEIMQYPDLLAHRIIDTQVDYMLPPVEEMAEVLHRLKREVLHDPRPVQLQTALELEEGLLKVHRAIVPELRVLQRLSQGDTPFVQESTRHYFKDVQDHLERLQNTIDMLRSMAESNLSFYLSATANRTADFTKALSLVAMMFLPLALVAGIYGMNFKNMPELEWRYGYFLIVGFILAVAAGVVAFYRRKHWI